MRRKIVGNAVGTTLNPERIIEYIKKDDDYNQLMEKLSLLEERIAKLEQGGNGGNTDIDTTISILGVAKLGNMKLA